MKTKIDISGLQFGLWRVLRQEGNYKGGGAKWLCECTCGTLKHQRSADLRNGKTKSCGCAGLNKRPLTHGQAGTRLHKIWKAMKARCKTNPIYTNKNITVCEEWQKFEPFFEWAKNNGYTDDLTIDRIDNSAGYYPSNCRWTTKQVQSENRDFVQTNKDGKLWWHIAQENGITQGAYRSRLYEGWPIEKAATYPLYRPLDPNQRANRKRDAAGRFI